MHIEKLLVTIFAAGVVGAGSLQAQSGDSDVQAKMREALRQKIAEMNAQSATNAPAPAAPAPPPAPTSPPPAPAPAEATPAPMPPRGRLTPEQEARVRAALHQASADLDAKENAGAAAAPAAPAPAPVVAPVPAPVPPPAPVAPVVIAPTPAPAATPMPRAGGLTPDQEAQVRAALHQAAADLDAKEKAGIAPMAPATPSPAPVVAPMTPAPATIAATSNANQKMDQDTALRLKLEEEIAAHNKADAEAAAERQAAMKKTAPAQTGVSSGNAASVPAPTFMVPGSKEARLYDLLQLYKADKITPTEYHEQRAKIVSEP